MKWSRTPNVIPRTGRPTGLRPLVEQLETRDVPATGFLRGTAYLDSNNNGQIDAGDAANPNAVISLFQADGHGNFNYLQQTTTDANGYYHFDNLAAGDYRLEDVTSNYLTTGASASSQFNSASVSPENVIQVSLVDTSDVQATYQSRPFFERIQVILGNTAYNQFVGQVALTATGGSLGANGTNFYSFCTDLNQDLGDFGAQWNASTHSAATSLINGERIAYLYNHYGTVVRPSNADAAGLQIAIWELEYDSVPDLSTGNFRYNFLYNTPTYTNPTSAQIAQENQEVLNRAAFYLQDSVGKSENAISLRADSVIKTGLQSMLATVNYDFLNTPAATISGTVYEDVNGNAAQDFGDGGLSGWTVQLVRVNSDQTTTTVATTTTDGSGAYTFTNLPAGTYQITESVQTGWGATTTNPIGVIVAAGATVTPENFGNARFASISGHKFWDRNADGIWSPNGLDNTAGTADDEVPLANWQIYVDLDGNDQYDPATDGPVATTDAAGYYSFTNLLPGEYHIREIQQSGWLRTTDDADITVASGQTVTGVDIGNVQAALLAAGDTATIGFWHNKNGQALIKNMNGSANSTALGDWLADSFPNIYGPTGADMGGKTNTQVAAYFLTVFGQTGMKLQAQVLATALAVYVTDSDLAGGTYAAKYGFTVNKLGTAADLFNIGTNGAAFGVANGTWMSIGQILAATNAQAVNGVLWAQNTTYWSMGNIVYTGVNQGGDIR